MKRNTIVVKKGLHPQNYSLIDDIQRTINTEKGWFTLGVIVLAKENDDLDVVVRTNNNYIDQGIFSIFDAFKHAQEEANLSVNFKSYTNNGEKNASVDGIVFSYKDVETANLVLECERTASAVTQQLKTVITVYRDGNKRILTLEKN